MPSGAGVVRSCRTAAEAKVGLEASRAHRESMVRRADRSPLHHQGLPDDTITARRAFGRCAPSLVTLDGGVRALKVRAQSLRRDDGASVASVPADHARVDGARRRRPPHTPTRALVSRPPPPLASLLPPPLTTRTHAQCTVGDRTPLRRARQSSTPKDSQGSITSHFSCEPSQPSTKAGKRDAYARSPPNTHSTDAHRRAASTSSISPSAASSPYPAPHTLCHA